MTAPDPMPLVERLLQNESDFHSKNLARQRIYRGTWYTGASRRRLAGRG